MKLTEKGKIAFDYACEFFPNECFSAADLSEKSGEKIAAASLTALVGKGLMEKFATKPVTYKLIEGAKELFLKRAPRTDFAPYSKKELDKQLKMSEQELIEYLNNKYNIVDGDYFCTPKCKSQNQNIKRKKEGLYIHHIKENERIKLSDPTYALKSSFEYQKGYNLVYCNIFEHLILHMKIVINNPNFTTFEECLGWGGFKYIAIEIAKFYGFYEDIEVENIHILDFISLYTNFLNSIEFQNTDVFKYYPNEVPYLLNEIDLWLNIMEEEEENDEQELFKWSFYEKMNSQEIYDGEHNDILILHDMLKKEFNLEKDEEFLSYLVTYDYYIGESEYQTYEIPLAVWLDNFNIYNYVGQLLDNFYEQSIFSSIYQFICNDFCPRFENLGGDIITGGIYIWEL